MNVNNFDIINLFNQYTLSEFIKMFANVSETGNVRQYRILELYDSQTKSVYPNTGSDDQNLAIQYANNLPFLSITNNNVTKYYRNLIVKIAFRLKKPVTFNYQPINWITFVCPTRWYDHNQQKFGIYQAASPCLWALINGRYDGWFKNHFPQAMQQNQFTVGMVKNDKNEEDSLVINDYQSIAQYNQTTMIWNRAPKNPQAVQQQQQPNATHFNPNQYLANQQVAPAPAPVPTPQNPYQTNPNPTHQYQQPNQQPFNPNSHYGQIDPNQIPNPINSNIQPTPAAPVAPAPNYLNNNFEQPNSFSGQPDAYDQYQSKQQVFDPNLALDKNSKS